MAATWPVAALDQVPGRGLSISGQQDGGSSVVNAVPASTFGDRRGAVTGVRGQTRAGLGAAQAAGSPVGQPLWPCLSRQTAPGVSTTPAVTLFSLCSWNTVTIFSPRRPLRARGAEGGGFPRVLF